MIDVHQKKLVTTRKIHKCHFCSEAIAKGEQAVNVRGKEDRRYINLYLHIPCNIEARKIDLFDEGLEHSTAIKDFSTADIADANYPF